MAVKSKKLEIGKERWLVRRFYFLPKTGILRFNFIALVGRFLALVCQACYDQFGAVMRFVFVLVLPRNVSNAMVVVNGKR